MRTLTKAAALAVTATFAGTLFFQQTQAQWVDQSQTPGGTIIAGDLDVAAIGGTNWINASNGTGDISVILPGETLVGTQAADLALDGDNMKATIRVDIVDANGPTTPPAGYSISYRVMDNTDTPLTGYLPMGANSNITFTPDTVTSTVHDGATDFSIEISVTTPVDAVPGTSFSGTYSVTANQGR